MESDSISEWVSWEVDALLVDCPSLSGMVCAIIPSDELVVGVLVVLNSEASATWVSDISVSSSEVRSLLIHTVGVGSPSLDDGLSLMLHLSVDLSGNSEGSLVP